MILYRKLLLIAISLMQIAQVSNAQSNAVELRIMAREMLGTPDSDGESYYDYRLLSWLRHPTGQESVGYSCVALDNVARYVWHPITNGTVRYSGPAIVSSSATYELFLEGWEEDGCGGNCTYNTNCNGADEGHCSKSLVSSFTLWDLPPGVPNNMVASLCGGAYMLRYDVTYSPPVPEISVVRSRSPQGGEFVVYNDGHLLCDDTQIELTPILNMNSNYLFYVDFEWEYWIEGDLISVENPEYCGGDPDYCPGFVDPSNHAPCCKVQQFIPAPHWRSVPGSTNGGVLEGRKILDLRTLNPQLQSLTQEKTIYFRVRSVSNGFGKEESSSPVAVILGVPAPTVTSLTSSPSCSESPTGAIYLNGFSGNSPNGYTYILRQGTQSDPCDPNISGSCTSIFRSGSLSGPTAALTQIPAGTYTLLVMNKPLPGERSCYSTYYITVESIPDLTLTLKDIVNNTCFNGNQGSVKFASSGGNQSSVNFVLANLSTSDMWSSPVSEAGYLAFNGLPVGNYRLESFDGCTPIAVRHFTITQPPLVSITTFSKTDASCSSPANGSILVGISKTTGSFDVSVSSGYAYTLKKDGQIYRQGTTNELSLSNLEISEDYELEVYEHTGNSCNGTTMHFSINGPPPVEITSINVTDVTCYGDTDGSISVAVQGGSGFYRFELVSSHGIFLTNNTGYFSNLPSENYQIMVFNDVEGCLDKYVFPSQLSIAQPEPLSVNITTSHLTCYEADDGKLSASVSGGNGGYNYQWEILTGSSWSSLAPATPVIQNLFPGEYRVSVTDQKGCAITSGSFQILEPAPIGIASITAIDAVCFGESGSILVDASGGTGDLSFAYSPDNISFIPFTESSLISPGSYYVRVVDENACYITSSGMVEITAPASQLTPGIQKSDYNGFNISCHDANDGWAVVTATGGNSFGYTGYQYAIDNGEFQNENRFEHITGGVHTLSVRDGRGCVASLSENFTEATQIVPEVTGLTHVKCFGTATGIVEVSASGGADNYLFSIDDQSFLSDPIFTGLSAGNHWINVQDKNGCVGGIEVEIEDINPPITVSTHSLPPHCNGENTGSLTIEASGGVEPYTYRINENEGESINANLPAGVYFVSVLDAEGCVSEIVETTMNEPDPLTFETIASTDIKCYDETGTIQIIGSGGTGSLAYLVSNNDGNSFFELPASGRVGTGRYQVMMHDENGCKLIAPEEIFISAPDQPLDFTYELSDYNGYNISCKGGANGSLDVNPFGGNGSVYQGYTLMFDGVDLQEKTHLNGIAAGKHTVSITDARGCKIEKEISFTESSVELNALVQSVNHVKCYGDQSGEIEVTANGGVPPYSFRLNGYSQQSTGMFTGLSTGTYQISVIDNNGCQSITSASIVHENPQIHLSAVVASPTCSGSNDGHIDLDVNGGTGTYQYVWTPGLPGASSVSGLGPGSYHVVVTDQQACTESLVITLTEPPPVALQTIVKPACYGKEDGQIALIGSGGSSPYKFFLNGVQLSTEKRGFNVAAGEYQIDIVDQNGCTAQQSVVVPLQNEKPEPAFLVASRRNALDILVVVDISSPPPDSIRWIFDEEAHLIESHEENPLIRFETPGTYEIEMMCFYEGCEYNLQKTITVNPFDNTAILEKNPSYSAFERISVSPNPSRGAVEVQIALSREYELSIVVYDMRGIEHYRKSWMQIREISEVINLEDASPGLYVLRAITELGIEEIRLVVNP